MNPGQQFLHLLSDPNIAFLLFTIGFYGILAELFHPNFFSGILGAIAIVVALIGSNALPLNVGGPAARAHRRRAVRAREPWWPVYGLLTVGGIVALVLGAFALWTGVEPGELAVDVAVSPWIIAIVVLVGLVYAWVLVRALMADASHGRRRPTRRWRRSSGAPPPPRRSSARRGSPMLAGESWSARGPRRRPSVRARRSASSSVEGLELIVEPAPAGDGEATEE